VDIAAFGFIPIFLIFNIFFNCEFNQKEKKDVLCGWISLQEIDRPIFAKRNLTDL